MMDPNLGRWTKQDPLGYVDGPNMYELVGSNPVGTLDPSGLIAEQPTTRPSTRPTTRPTTGPVVEAEPNYDPDDLPGNPPPERYPEDDRPIPVGPYDVRGYGSVDKELADTVINSIRLSLTTPRGKELADKAEKENRRIPVRINRSGRMEAPEEERVVHVDPRPETRGQYPMDVFGEPEPGGSPFGPRVRIIPSIYRCVVHEIGHRAGNSYDPANIADNENPMCVAVGLPPRAPPRR